MVSDKKPVFIGTLAKRAGVSVDTIRYYEKIGLLPPANRTQSGYRNYGPLAKDRLIFIQKAQKLGFTLGEIKRVLDQRGTGELPCASVISMAQTRLNDVESKLDELTILRGTLRKHLRKWKRASNNEACAATQFCNLIEELELGN